MKINTPVTDVEHLVDNSQRLISTTDKKGIITSVNQAFIDISGFREEELIGQSHNIVRHPDMPPAAFEDLWATLKRGDAWMGLVKNRCKDGDFYWVNAYVTPVYEGQELVGYQSVRTTASRAYIRNAEKLYSRLSRGKKAEVSSTSSGLSSAAAGGLLVLAVLVTLALLGDATPLNLLMAALLMAIPAIILFYFQRRPWQRLQQLSEGIYRSDLATLSYRGGSSSADRTEVAIQALRSQQTTLVELLQHSSDHLSGTVKKTNDVVQANNHAVSQQNQDIAQLATAVTELSSTIQEVARHAQQTAETTSQASQEADNGSLVVDQAAESISVLASDVARAGQLVEQLREEAAGISSIVHVINSVAEQTNLLALNAAIEAARAGEQGRGFAVVADEVRSLATRTQESTSEIEAMISNLQQHVDRIVSVMETGQQHAQRSEVETTRVKELLQNVTLMINQASNMNVQIATATEEQSAVTEEINRNVTGIHDVIAEIGEASKLSAAAGMELEQVATGLNSMLTHFRKA